MNDPADPRMTGNPYIDAFLRALDDLERPASADPAPKPKPIKLDLTDLTAWDRLLFLRWLVDSGRLPS